jgi:hypothetical protein
LLVRTKDRLRFMTYIMPSLHRFETNIYIREPKLVSAINSNNTNIVFIIIISAERRPLLDIGLPQSSPRRSVLCSLDRRSTLWGAYQRCVSRYAVAIRGPFRPKASPPHNVYCLLPLEVCNSSGYVGDLSYFTDLIISDIE